MGTVLAHLGQPGATPPVQPDKREESNGATPARAGSAAAVAEGARAKTVAASRISPVVARIAAEHNVDLNLVQGTGRGARITKKNILAYVEARDKAPAPLAPSTSAEPPRPEPAGGLPGQVVPLSKMRAAIAEHMVRSKHTSPHVTTIFEVDFSAVAAHRQTNKEAFARDGANLTFTTYLVAATAQALKAFPLVNSTWTAAGIQLQRDVNIGIAAAIPDGLIVPVIKQADNFNLLGLSRVINDVTERARTGKLRPDDVAGGTFTITNHGVSGSLFATPIINQPQCGILGVGKIEKRVKVIDDAIAIRPLAYVGLTFDHRILDGATADHFVSTIKRLIEAWS